MIDRGIGGASVSEAKEEPEDEPKDERCAPNVVRESLSFGGEWLLSCCRKHLP